VKALGWALLLAGCAVFAVTVDRSMWVLVSPVLMWAAAVVLAHAYRDVHTIGLGTASKIIDAELRRIRTIPVGGGVLRSDRPLTQAEADRIRREWLARHGRR
jgi:hypothetical protein